MKSLATAPAAPRSRNQSLDYSRRPALRFRSRLRSWSIRMHPHRAGCALPMSFWNGFKGNRVRRPGSTNCLSGSNVEAKRRRQMSIAQLKRRADALQKMNGPNGQGSYTLEEVCRMAWRTHKRWCEKKAREGDRIVPTRAPTNLAPSSGVGDWHPSGDLCRVEDGREH